MQLLSPAMKLDNLGIPVGLVQDIIFRLLFNESDVNIARFAEVLGIHASLIDELLARMKQEHLVEVVRAGGLGSLSFTYGLTEAGTKRARDSFERSQYVGRVPVSLEKYTKAILLQSKREQRITPTQVKQALGFLILPDNFDRRLGPAVNAGSSLFLYGPPVQKQR